MKNFKRIYVEISNYCNLNCSFCDTSKNTRMMSLEEFKTVCLKLKDYTKEIVLHVLGEPLVHPDIIEILDYAREYFKVMITTNGFLLKDFMKEEFIKFNKMNISVHSSYFLDKEKTLFYLDNVLKFIDYAHFINDDIIFNIRLWANSNDFIKKHNDLIIDYLNLKFSVNILDNTRLKRHVVVTFDHEFEWPKITNPYNTDKGTCKGGKTHIAVLANGNVSICCLDSCASSNLGNIFESDLESILEGENYRNAISYFSQNKLYLEICKRCKYHNRKD